MILRDWYHTYCHYGILPLICLAQVWTNSIPFAVLLSTPVLRGSLPKSGPLDVATKNTFALFFVGEEALAGVY